MTRTILVHVNVEVPDDDPRSEDEIGDWVGAGLEQGMVLEEGSTASGSGSHIEIALVEEIA